jgi:ribosomal protein L29
MKDLIKKTGKELVVLLKEKREALRVFRFASSGAKTKNVKEGNSLKKEIARIMTALNANKK